MHERRSVSTLAVYNNAMFVTVRLWCLGFFSYYFRSKCGLLRQLSLFHFRWPTPMYNAHSYRKNLVTFCGCLPTGQPPVVKLLRCPILRFFAQKGRHDSRINVKFGTVEGISAVPNFTLLGDIWGFLVPKTRKFAKKIPVLQTFSPHRGESLARF